MRKLIWVLCIAAAFSGAAAADDGHHHEEPTQEQLGTGAFSRVVYSGGAEDITLTIPALAYGIRVYDLNQHRRRTLARLGVPAVGSRN